MKTFRHQHSRPKKNTLVVGREAIIKALKEGVALERIYMQGTIHGELVDEIKSLAANALVPINKVPVEKLNNMNVSNHEG
ncbi:MAG: RNA methyltransferase substrate-binding domain-containing protein, partial [Ferruginibacter sp.]